MTQLLQVLQVRAVDGDRDVNHAIEYAIVSGPGQVFGINKDTGTVYSKVYTLLELGNFDINIRNIQTRLLPVPFPCLSAYLRFQTLDTIVNRHLNKVST